MSQYMNQNAKKYYTSPVSPLDIIPNFTSSPDQNDAGSQCKQALEGFLGVICFFLTVYQWKCTVMKLPVALQWTFSSPSPKVLKAPILQVFHPFCRCFSQIWAGFMPQGFMPLSYSAGFLATEGVIFEIQKSSWT